jgi:hypothetical protein
MKIPNGGFKATVFEYVCGLYEFKIRKNSPERGEREREHACW